MNNRVKKPKKVLPVIFIVLFCMIAAASAPHYTAFLFLALAVLLIPAKPFTSLWDTLLKDKLRWLKPVMLTVLFVVFCVLSPLSKDNKDKAPVDSANVTTSQAIEETGETETETETETEKVTEKETEKVTEKETEKVTEKETEKETEKVTEKATEKETEKATEKETTQSVSELVSPDAIPAFNGMPYVTINGNVPFFRDSDVTDTAFENYSELDSLGRCGVTFANICIDIMPTEERGDIGAVKPTGWHTVKYDCVDGKYLYNRCHLIGFQLAGENANNRNLITGTRYMNVDGMLPFENMVADYVKESGNHVLYRVTPLFDGNNLVASGVLMEARSVEDNGEGILFNVFCYNNQPGVDIDYATGESWLNGDAGVPATEPVTVAPTTAAPETEPVTVAPTVAPETEPATVVVHITDTGKKYHTAGCRYLNESDHEVTLEEAKRLGLDPCGVCNPPQ